MVSPSLPVPEQYALPPLPTVGGIGPDSYVLDIFRVAAAQVISESVGVNIEAALTGVDIGGSGRVRRSRRDRLMRLNGG